MMNRKLIKNILFYVGVISFVTVIVIGFAGLIYYQNMANGYFDQRTEALSNAVDSANSGDFNAYFNYTIQEDFYSNLYHKASNEAYFYVFLMLIDGALAFVVVNIWAMVTPKQVN